MAELYRVRGLERDDLKVLVPELLVGIKDYLSGGSKMDPGFSYKGISSIAFEERGNLDEFDSSYYFDPRISKAGEGSCSGKMILTFYEQGRLYPKSEFDVSFQRQSLEDKTLSEIISKIKAIFDSKGITYETVRY